MTPTRPSMTATEWGLLLILSVIWGGSFFFTGVAVKELPPLTIVAPVSVWQPLPCMPWCGSRDTICRRARKSGLAFSAWGS